MPGASRTTYAGAAVEELRLARRVLGRAVPAETVFFGGGTPTLLSARGWTTRVPLAVFARISGASEVPPGLRSAVEGDALRVLLRDVFKAAGGTHDDWDAYDRVMAEQRRTCVFIRPARIYGRQP